MFNVYTLFINMIPCVYHQRIFFVGTVGTVGTCRYLRQTPLQCHPVLRLYNWFLMYTIFFFKMTTFSLYLMAMSLSRISVVNYITHINYNTNQLQSEVQIFFTWLVFYIFFYWIKRRTEIFNSWLDMVNIGICTNWFSFIR